MSRTLTSLCFKATSSTSSHSTNSDTVRTESTKPGPHVCSLSRSPQTMLVPGKQVRHTTKAWMCCRTSNSPKASLQVSPKTGTEGRAFTSCHCIQAARPAAERIKSTSQIRLLWLIVMKLQKHFYRAL